MAGIEARLRVELLTISSEFVFSWIKLMMISQLLAHGWDFLSPSSSQ